MQWLRNRQTERGLWGCVADAFVPYIPASRKLPETTVRGIILAVILSVILGAANLYLGLRVGLTVSASIPAAVIAMAVLRLFRNSNVLEYNAVQTAASAGESLAAGVLFTIPALLILGYWESVQYWETALIALVGGLLGILFTVPIRRALIVEGDLAFPEGVATSEVLKAGEAGGERAGIVALVIGGVAGLVFKALEAGFGWFQGAASAAYRMGAQSVGAIGLTLSPALIAVGYIVKLRIAFLVFLGGAIGWIIGIPLYSEFAGDAFAIEDDFLRENPGASTYDVAFQFWSTRIRYMGVGAMLIGGLWSLVKLRKPLGQALSQGFKKSDGGEVIRTEQEISPMATYLGVAGMTIPMAGLYWYVTGSFLVALVMTFVMLVAGFVFSALGGYLAGLVGSSNNPISGVTIITVIFAALSLKLLGVESELGAAATIMVAAIIACAGAIASDNIQDLKAGHLLGATPKRQQIMQIVGVSAAAIPLGFVLQLLHNAYTIGSQDLAAPQAGLMASVAGAIFGTAEKLPMNMLVIGAIIAVVLIALDEILGIRKSGFRTPVMPVAVGIYLPIELSTPIFVGGLVAWLAARRYKGAAELKEKGLRNGVLFSSGLIAGEALMGIGIAAPVAFYGSRTPAESLPTDLDLPIVWPGLVLLGYIVFVLYHIAARPRRVAEA